MNVAGIVASWKSYKLSYSAFWGIKLTPAKFSNPKHTFKHLWPVLHWPDVMVLKKHSLMCFYSA